MYDNMNQHLWERSSKTEEENNSIDDLYSRITQKHSPFEVTKRPHPKRFEDAGYSYRHCILGTG